MAKIENNNVFIQNTNIKDRILVLHDKIKRHLSAEYLYLSEKKSDIENQIIQLEIEKEKKGKKLFSNLEQKDNRKYFSPLNIKEIDEDKKDERQIQIMADIARLQSEARQLENQLIEIKDFLNAIDDLKLEKYSIKEIKEDLD